MKQNIKKVMAITGIVFGSLGLVAGGAMLHSSLSNPKIVFEEKIVTNTVEVPGETIVVEQVVEVPVDNGNLDLVLNEVFDNNGNVSYLLDDLDDDELDLIVGRIVFANEIKSLALDEVKNSLADELDHVEILLSDNSTYEFDEDDFEKIRLDDDSDEIVLSNVDYDDGDADVSVFGKFRHDDKWFSFEAVVEIEDSNVDDFEVVSIVEE